ncbi:MAG TPA: anti-sigma factor [Ohtaekwangia sp.]|uniref:anti-sigma factor n=1 Tax=Ohtaekwangia sp. TaxID=2066019 RepID=UPI002F949585
MSTPDPSKMKLDCPEKNECLKMLQAILDGEATADQKDHFLKHHLEECMPCYKNYHLEVAIRQLLKTKCCQDAPQQLVDDIKAKVIQNLAS